MNADTDWTQVPLEELQRVHQDSHEELWRRIEEKRLTCTHENIGTIALPRGDNYFQGCTDCLTATGDRQWPEPQVFKGSVEMVDESNP